MEKDFKELLRLLQIKSLNELLFFENGKLKGYHDLYVFKYKMRNFCEIVYSAAANLTNNFTIDQIISAFRKLTLDMVYSLTNKQELLRYVAKYK
ncbi:hypothetical protein [Albibacterium bauzanense]|uniref:Uncharacterized protein n=1 Tax=Albibacterium bauzanense TaxID=653929 RepID=A0A4R1M1C8_9SPHI|nr:hypothetical protein [Albibacterium bauzanense]TCK85012.1 hypothetical protein C8N28_0308 [Albibacterium bauzanense]